MDRRSLLRVFPIGIVVTLVACSSESSSVTATAESRACVAHDATSANLATPSSFEKDVLPILRQSCGLSASCHGGSRAPLLAARLDAETVRLGLVGQPSKSLPSMNYVTAGDPSSSFLQRKIDGDACLFDAECATGSCGEAMPVGAPLPNETRDVIRRWIAQGAAE